MADYNVVNPDGPFKLWASITPNDSTDLTVAFKAIYVGGAGNLALRGADDVDVTFTAPPVGTVLRVSPKRVLATGTTATLLVGLR